MLYACSAGSPTSPSDFFFFNDTATTEIYTLSLHDALPISESTVGLGGLVGHLLHRCGHVRPLHVLHLQTAQHRNDATVDDGLIPALGAGLVALFGVVLHELGAQLLDRGG